jgi:hypothetical protein
MRYEVTKEDRKAEEEEKPSKKSDGVMKTDTKAVDKQAEKEEKPEHKGAYHKAKKEMAKKKAKGMKKMANKNDYKED